MQIVKTITLNIDGQEVMVNRLEDGTFEKPDYLKGAEREVVGHDEIFLKRNPNNTGAGRIVTNGDGTTKDGRKAPYQKSESAGTITAPASPLAKQFSGYGSAIKPAAEFIVMAMKPLDKNYANNAEVWGVSGLWIDGARITVQNGDQKGEGGRIKENTARKAKIYGQYNKNLPQDDAKGRYPANVILDSSAAVESEFDKAGVSISTGGDGSKFKASIFRGIEKDSVTVGGKGLGDTGTPSRFFKACPPDPTAHPEMARFKYCPKAGKRERGNGNNHPTVKSLELIKYLCRLTRVPSPSGGIVLDPFAGSGTTALAALIENRDYILIEKEPEYVEIIKRRIAEYTGAEIAPVEHKVNEVETVKQMSLW